MPQTFANTTILQDCMHKARGVAQVLATQLDTLRGQLTQLRAMGDSARIGSIAHSVALEQAGVTEGGIEALRSLQVTNRLYTSILLDLEASVQGLGVVPLVPQLAIAEMQGVRRLMAAEDQIDIGNIGNPERASTLLEQYAAETADVSPPDLSSLEIDPDPLEAVDFDIDAFFDDVNDETRTTPSESRSASPTASSSAQPTATTPTATDTAPVAAQVASESDVVAAVASSSVATNAAAVVGGATAVVVAVAAIAGGVAQAVVNSQKAPVKAPLAPSQLTALAGAGQVQERYDNASWDEMAQYFHEGESIAGNARYRRRLFADGYLDIQTSLPAFTRSDRTATAGVAARQDAAIQNYTARFYRNAPALDSAQPTALALGTPLYFYGLKESSNANVAVKVDGGKMDVANWTNFADQRQDYHWYTGEAANIAPRGPAPLPLKPLPPAQLNADVLVQSLATLHPAAAVLVTSHPAYNASMLVALASGPASASENRPDAFK